MAIPSTERKPAIMRNRFPKQNPLRRAAYRFPSLSIFPVEQHKRPIFSAPDFQV
jgi:hypothetical protein